MAAPALRWGVIGTGWIAERFVAAVRRGTRQEIVAAGSRDGDRAKEFAGRFGMPKAYGSYDDLVADPGIDVLYVATPHNAHHPCAVLALDAGKHVVIEKPIALNAAQARDLATRAQSHGLLCLEALWTYFLPKFDVIRQVLDGGVLGEVKSVIADFGEYFTSDHRIMRPELAGGPLLDLGTYPLSLAVAALGPPERVVAVGQPAPSGVNGQLSAILTTAEGNQAVVHTTLFSNTPTAATIAGTAATLQIPGQFFRPGPFTVTVADGRRRLEFTEELSGYDGLRYEAAEAARCVAEVRHESPVRPLGESIATMQVLDETRRQIGVVFPGEQ